MSKKMSIKDCIKTLNITAPEPMEYYVNIETDKDRKKFIDQIKKIIRSSVEYKDYIHFLKENLDLNKCIFFQNMISDKTNRRSKVSIEIHHEPFTLHDYVNTVINKYQTEGIPLNSLMIADEVLELHYANKVGLVPLSKTMHEVIHNSTKVIVPINMCYGDYSQFLNEYEPYISEEMYDKLQRKMDMTQNLTPESFEAIKKEFTYIDVNGYEDVNKMETTNSQIA